LGNTGGGTKLSRRSLSGVKSKPKRKSTGIVWGRIGETARA